jgi:hypothetical protein
MADLLGNGQAFAVIAAQVGVGGRTGAVPEPIPHHVYSDAITDRCILSLQSVARKT